MADKTGGGRRENRPRPPRDGRPPRRERITVTKTGQLPKWVRDEVVRSTPKDRRDPALSQLEQGLRAFADEKFRAAYNHLRKAKAMASRAATIRELLGLAAYELAEWEDALKELRTFRRLTGDTTHVAVEMDCLRALGRHNDVEKTWGTFLEVGGSRDAEDEARVVYASYLLDRGRKGEAWQVIKPGRLVAQPPASALRRWAVAAKVAAATGDRETARKLVDAIRERDPDIAWLEELERDVG